VAVCIIVGLFTRLFGRCFVEFLVSLCAIGAAVSQVQLEPGRRADGSTAVWELDLAAILFAGGDLFALRKLAANCRTPLRSGVPATARRVNSTR